MTNISPPPSTTEIVDKSGKAQLPWVTFFENQYLGDTGTSFTPTFTSLTEVGTAGKTGYYYRLSQNLYYFAVTITPATSVTSTAGTTYFDFPLDITRDGANLAVTNGLGSQAGMNVASNNRIYIPALSAVTTPITIVGIVEAR